MRAPMSHMSRSIFFARNIRLSLVAAQRYKTTLYIFRSLPFGKRFQLTDFRKPPFRKEVQLTVSCCVKVETTSEQSLLDVFKPSVEHRKAHSSELMQSNRYSFHTLLGLPHKQFVDHFVQHPTTTLISVRTLRSLDI